MGVNYSPVLYVGKQFEDEEDARNFYEEFFLITSEDEDIIAECGLEELIQGKMLDSITLNYYYTSGFIIGVNIGRFVRQPENFAEEVQKAISKWKKLFGEEKYEIIHTVCVW